jgi:6-pyruvoyltetrahydropterin/6-carboxytetrahydropterin synthase
MKITATKIKTFCCAHYLNNYDGACANMHGHNYKVEVTVERKVLNKQDMVIDFKDLSPIIEDVIVEWDHKTMNEIEAFNPTAENMAQAIAKRVQSRLDKEIMMDNDGLYSTEKVTKVRLWETDTSYVEVFPWEN